MSGPMTKDEADIYARDLFQRYRAAKGWTQRQRVVNEIFNHEDGFDNALHRILSYASRLDGE